MSKLISSLLLASTFIHLNLNAIQDDSHYFYLDVISNEHGISHTVVQKIFKDSYGFFWFGTEKGQNRYNAYRCSSLPSNSKGQGYFSQKLVTSIFEDKDRHLWVGTNNGELIRIYLKEMTIQRYPFNMNNSSANTKEIEVHEINQDKKGTIWIATSKGLWFYNKLQDSVILHENGHLNEHVFVDCISIDNQENMLIGTRGLGLLIIQDDTIHRYLSDINNPYVHAIVSEGDKQWIATHGDGLYLVDHSKNQKIHFPVEGLPSGSLSNLINCMIPWKDDYLLFGTYEGIFIFNKQDKTFQKFSSHLKFPEYPQNIPVNSLYLDDQNILWAGTRGFGVYKYYLQTEGFEHYLPHPDDLSHTDNKIHCAYNISDDNYILGTEHGFMYVNKNANHLKRYTIPGSYKRKVPVTKIINFGSDTLLLGTWNAGVWLFSLKDKSFFKPEVNAGSSKLNQVYDIYFDGKDDIWVGYHNDGLINLNKRFVVKKHFPQLSVSSAEDVKSVRKIIKDHKGMLWLGLLSGGVDIYNPETDSFTNYFSDYDSRDDLTNNDILCLFQDNRNNIWIGTNGGGLNVFLYKEKKFKQFSVREGLISDVIYSIKQDEEGAIWLQTNRGITRLEYYKNHLHPMAIAKNFGLEDGLPTNKFHFCSIDETSEGRLLLPSKEGLVSFLPTSLKRNTDAPKVIFTEIEVNNKNILHHDNNNIEPFPKTLNVNQLENITLKHNYNRISVEFSALDYYKSDKNSYLVKLEGFDDQWNFLQNQRSVTYLNLPPGSYQLKVKAANSDNIWNENGRTLNIKILRPWWFSNWAFAVYSFLFIFSLFLVRAIALYNERKKNKEKLARVKLEKQRELDQYKLDFFTKITHEIRTPITLIMGPLEKMLDEPSDAANSMKYLNIIKSNSDKLYHLTNQILDLRKVDEGKLSLHKITDNIVPFLKEIVNRFIPFAESKSIQLSFETNVESFVWSFDGSVIDKILSNLISNAIKFTPEDGFVKVLLFVRKSAGEEYTLELSVKDTGKGISQQEIKNIFQPFYQTHNSEANIIPGTGIGLSLVKELTDLHNGKINVKSIPGEGSEFFVVFLSREFPERVTSTDLKGNLGVSPGKTLNHASSATDKPEAENIKVLIAEDNEELNDFLFTLLKDKFKVYKTYNGVQAYKSAQKIVPDLILSDVMMPEMDGIEFCSKIKSNHLTCHIPFIMLTVKSNEESQINGLKSGADDYIFKPFNPAILQMKINNMLRLSEKLRNSFSEQLFIEKKENNIVHADPLIENIIAIIHKQIENPELSIEVLTKEIGVGRSQLFMKVKNITGMTLTELIQGIRLKQAFDFLSKGTYNVSEVAYMVGFKNVSHFTKLFKNKFGKVPSELLKL